MWILSNERFKSTSKKKKKQVISQAPPAVAIADGGDGIDIGGVWWSDAAVLSKKKKLHIKY